MTCLRIAILVAATMLGLVLFAVSYSRTVYGPTGLAARHHAQELKGKNHG